MDISFFLVVAFFVTHEIDAVRAREWRLLFFLRDLDDEQGFWWFTALHVPLMFLILLFLESLAFQVGLSAFAIIHAFLHGWLRNHPKYEFKGWLSNALIGGAAVSGLLYLLVFIIQR